jgi:hypothetical protein
LEAAVKKYALCCIAVLLPLASPLSATIAKYQSAAIWNQTNTLTCQVPFGGNTQLTDLIVVWTTWQTTPGTPNTLTASVADTQHNGDPNTLLYPSAVGPTVQPSATNPTGAQIFYAKNLQHVAADTITVTYSGTAASASCVIVEYSGLDTMYPLDSVSAGYSYSTGTLLDSGTAAPANANLLVFGGGTSDAGTAGAGSGFTSIQLNGGSVTEQMIVSGNNTLQRATAGLTGVGAPGDWVMQMAVFRDASWTVTNAWSPSRIGQIRHANQFPGIDIGTQINNAYADCPANGCHIKVDAGNYVFATPILFSTVAKPAWLECDPGMTTLTYAPVSGNAIMLDWGGAIIGADVTVSRPGIFGCVIRGTSHPVATLQLCYSGDTNGACTGSNGCSVASGGATTCTVDNTGVNPSVTPAMNGDSVTVSGFTGGSACLNVAGTQDLRRLRRYRRRWEIERLFAWFTELPQVSCPL